MTATEHHGVTHCYPCGRSWRGSNPANPRQTREDAPRSTQGANPDIGAGAGVRGPQAAWRGYCDLGPCCLERGHDGGCRQ